MKSGVRTRPISRRDDEQIVEMAMGIPLKPMRNMYFTASSNMASACELPTTMSESTCRGNTMHTRRYRTIAAAASTALKLSAWRMPRLSPAP